MESIFKNYETKKTYHKGEVLYHENTPSFGIFCVRSGTVKIFTTDRNGKEVILKLASRGDLFGHGYFTGSKMHINTAKAVEETECYFIESNELNHLLKTDDEFAKRILGHIGEELRDSQTKCRDLIKKNVRERLASYFQYMAGNHSENCDGTIRINVQLSREEIASMIGTANETAIRFISEFKELGLIKEEDKFFHILKPDELSTISLGHS